MPMLLVTILAAAMAVTLPVSPVAAQAGSALRLAAAIGAGAAPAVDAGATGEGRPPVEYPPHEWEVAAHDIEVAPVDVTSPAEFAEPGGGDGAEGAAGVGGDARGDLPRPEDAWRQALVDAAETQLGVGYWSLHYGPAGDPYGNGEGFGCAMFVSYAYNNVFFDGARGDEPGDGPIYERGFAGWTQAFWSNGTGDATFGRNVGFHEVGYGDARPGDVVCYCEGDAYATSDSCYHVALYLGDGMMIDSNYDGVGERSVWLYGSDTHFLSFSGSAVAEAWRP